MLTVHGNETDREIELEGCPETRLTNVTLIKSRPPPTRRKRRGSPYSNGVPFLRIQSNIYNSRHRLLQPGERHRAVRCRARCDTNSSQNVSTRISGIYYFNHGSAHELPRHEPRVSPRTWKHVAPQTVCCRNDREGKAAGYIHSKF